MPRNSEVIRQWEIIRALDASRLGETVAALAQARRVSRRTIWRDLAALQEAGFPLYDEKVDGRTRWKLDSRPFRELTETGFTLTQLSALYFSRTLAECLAGTPFRDDLRQAFDKLEAVLPARMRRFLDRLPALLRAKPAPRKRQDERGQREAIARLLEAILHQRRVAMRYHSFSSRRTKDYLVEPYRLVYAEGGLYLFAFVPAYRELRTFALERIRTLALLDDTFEPIEGISPDAFPHSLGVHSGPPERVEMEFAARIADYVRERIWHPSQRLREQADGSVRLTLEVCNDTALRAWILGFGSLARVVSPAPLAEQILEELEEAREIYAPRIDFEMPVSHGFDLGQPILPFSRSQSRADVQ